MTEKVIAMNSAQVIAWLNRGRELAAECGCPQAVEPASRALRNRPLDQVVLAVVGGPNSGKSTLINHLLGRDVLPTSFISTPCEFMIEPAGPGEPECFARGGDNLPLDKLRDLAEPASPAARILIRITAPWLASRNMTLVEKPEFDAVVDKSGSLSEEYLTDVDVILLVIDVLTPLRRPELALLAHCVRHSLPAIVFLAKSDRLSGQEKIEVRDFLRTRVETLSSDIPVVGCSDQESPAQIADLKCELEKLIADTDVVHLRNIQVSQMLLAALAVVAGSAQAGLQAQQQDQESRKKEQEKRTAAVSTQALVWLEIQQAMDARRHRVADSIAEHLANNRNTILETLEFELDRTSDVKRWWERDLPFRLQRELRSVAGQITGVLNRQLAGDLRWLQDELQKQFRYSLPMLGESVFAIDSVTSSLREMTLTEMNRFTIISRIGTVAAVIAAGTLLATAGIKGVAMAVSVGAGLISEEVARRRSARDKEKVRAELSRVVQTAELDYSRAVSENLRDNYNRIIADLKHHQALWQEAQMQALARVASGQTDSTLQWAGIRRQTNILMGEISNSISHDAHVEDRKEMEA